jgi:hypothetical protein
LSKGGANLQSSQKNEKLRHLVWYDGTTWNEQDIGIMQSQSQFE